MKDPTDKELEMIRRKIGELYALMTGLPEFQTKQFIQKLGPEKIMKWGAVLHACRQWVQDHDEKT